MVHNQTEVFVIPAKAGIQSFIPGFRLKACRNDGLCHNIILLRGIKNVE